MEINETEPEIKIEYEDTNVNDPLFVNKKYKKDVTSEELRNTPGNIEYSKISIGNETWFKCIDDSGKYHCRFCDLAYCTLQTLRVHTKTKHHSKALIIKAAVSNNKRNKKFKCHGCKKVFGTLKDLEYHFRITHKFTKENFCHICKSVYDNEDALSDHLSSKHSIALSKLHVCDMCGYTTIKLSHYKQHRNIHLPQKVEKCQYCNYETSHLSNLNIHLQIHNEDKPYLCDFNGCFYKSKSRASLKSHQIKHNKDNNFKYCDQCSFRTVYMQTLRKHLNSHTRNSIKINTAIIER